MTAQYHTIILGGGNAGFGVSSVLKEAGKSMAIVEQAEFGGTCPNRGCTPKKILVEAAGCLDMIRRAEAHGIEVSAPVIHWEKLIARKDEMIGFIPDAMHKLADNRATVYRGQARFTGPNQITVGDDVLEAENIVIATGSKTRPLPIPGAEHLLTSDDVLTLRELPDSVVFVGGGVIAMEFSHVYARAGVKVTILEAMPQLLPRLDSDAVQVLHDETEKLGVTIHTAVQVQQIRQTDTGMVVDCMIDDTHHTFMASHVVNGTGRVANVDGLDLHTAGITVDRGHIETDAYLRTVDNPAVWIAGDAIARAPQLSPVATQEGRLVGQNILKAMSQATDYRVIPTSVFTLPTLSSVGLTEQEATAQGLQVKVQQVEMGDWFSSRSHVESRAWAKVIIDEAADAFVGVHIVGHKGEELINMFAMAMRHNITATHFKADLLAYPTFGADIKNWW